MKRLVTAFSSRRSHRRIFTTVIAVFAMALLGACGSANRDQEETAEAMGKRGADAVEKSTVSASPNRSVGRIEHVDAEGRLAVIALNPGSQSIPAILIARDRNLRPQAVLERSEIRVGGAFGVKVLQGQPQRGNSVVVPGTADLQRLARNFAPASSPGAASAEPAASDEEAQEVLENIRIR